MIKEKMVPAIPPEDYKGSQADWMIALIERGLWTEGNGGWYGDVMIAESIYDEIVSQCEDQNDEENNLKR